MKWSLIMPEKEEIVVKIGVIVGLLVLCSCTTATSPNTPTINGYWHGTLYQGLNNDILWATFNFRLSAYRDSVKGAGIWYWSLPKRNSIDTINILGSMRGDSLFLHVEFKYWYNHDYKFKAISKDRFEGNYVLNWPVYLDRL